MLVSASESKMTTISCGIVNTERRMRSIMRKFMVSLRTGNRTVRTTLSFMREFGPISILGSIYERCEPIGQDEPAFTQALNFSVVRSKRMRDLAFDRVLID